MINRIISDSNLQWLTTVLIRLHRKKSIAK